jgi:hypothetical protein
MPKTAIEFGYLKKYYLYNMKKITIALTIIALYSFSSCSIFHHDEYGCPKSSAAIGAEKLVSGDQKAEKEAGRHKFFVQTGVIYK